MDKLNELVFKKAQFEQAFAEKEKQARALVNDITLIEQLLLKKSELNKVVDEINAMRREYETVCKEIETESEKAEQAKAQEVKEEKK